MAELRPSTINASTESKQQRQNREASVARRLSASFIANPDAGVSKQQIQDRAAVNDALDRLMGAANAAAGVGMNIEIVEKHIEKMKTYTYLGAIHADHSVSQIRVNTDTSIETISDILEMWENHKYDSKTSILLVYVANGNKLDAETVFSSFSDNATPEEFARCLKDAYGETGVQVIDFPTHRTPYTMEGGLGIDADVIRATILGLYKASRPVRTSVEVPEFLTRR